MSTRVGPPRHGMEQGHPRRGRSLSTKATILWGAGLLSMTCAALGFGVLLNETEARNKSVCEGGGTEHLVVDPGATLPLELFKDYGTRVVVSEDGHSVHGEDYQGSNEPWDLESGELATISAEEKNHGYEQYAIRLNLTTGEIVAEHTCFPPGTRR